MNINTDIASDKPLTIAVAGTGYVGLSLAVLLSQNHKVYAVDIVPEKVEKLIPIFLRFRTQKLRIILQTESWI